MKKKVVGQKAKRIFAAIGCLILAVLFWIAVKYGQLGDIPIAMLHLG